MNIMVIINRRAFEFGYINDYFYGKSLTNYFIILKC